MPRSADTASHAVASLRARIAGYAVDMVIFAAISLVMLVIAGFVLLVSTNWAQDDASDPQFYTFLSIIGVGIPSIWTAMNLLLLRARAQTGGQYVAGIRVVREDGERLSGRDAVLWWLCFNPLLFSWPMALVACLPLSAVIALALSRVTIVAFGVVVTICFAAPLIALAAAALDAENRALHDRIIGTRLVPAG
ncbi:MAG: RDD family protein [Chloroflexota bacterium]|nr:RDD family protein [Chloroflexota bacterium]